MTDNNALPTKSCFTCKNLKTWSYPGTLEDPPDEGWECGLLFNEHYISDEVADACKSEEELIEEDEAMVYDLSDKYYPSEHNPNNYGYDMTEFESRIWS